MDVKVLTQSLQNFKNDKQSILASSSLLSPQRYFLRTEFKCSFTKLNDNTHAHDDSLIPTEGKEAEMPKPSMHILNELKCKNYSAQKYQSQRQYMNCQMNWCGTANPKR